jgi:hypothetical protein
MSWLRLDDGFAQHPKFEGWSSAQKWALIELFCYCAAHKTDGLVPDDLALLPRGVTRSLLAFAESSGFLDRDAENHLTIHDWEQYNPKDATNAQRQERWRARRRNRLSGVTRSVTETVTEALPTRARDPVPSPTPEELVGKQAVLSYAEDESSYEPGLPASNGTNDEGLRPIGEYLDDLIAREREKLREEA